MVGRAQFLNVVENRWPPLEVIARSDTGRVRATNEDAVLVMEGVPWLALSDGMGGYRGGEVASRVALAAVASLAPAEVAPEMGLTGALELMERAIQEANAAIFREVGRQPALAGMGATIVSALFWSGRLVVGHVGDSRMYRLRGGELLRLTRDHSLIQEQLDRGLIAPDEVAFSPDRGRLTRALGVDPQVQPDMASYPAFPGDVYLLCSDGLTDMVTDRDLATVLALAEGRLQATADELVALANARGGKDNISLIMAQVPPDRAGRA